MRFRKRGEKAPGAGPAAALVGIILLIFVFYVILIPPEDRARILEGDSSSSPGSFPESKNVLLSERLGALDFVPRDQIEHVIPNVQLMGSREAAVLLALNTFEVSDGMFSAERKESRFSLNPGAIDHAFLSFQAPVRSGQLRITLNGQELFSGPVVSESPPAIAIASRMFEDDNVLVFEAFGTFFEDNEFTLSDVKVIGDVIDSQGQLATSTFVLEDGELENLNRARMSFYVECLQQDVGTLSVLLNGRAIYSAVPVCDAQNQVDLFKGDFVGERNTLSFSLTRGGVFVETIRLKSYLEESKPFIGYFTLGTDQFFDVDRGAREVILRIDFVDDGESKEADLSVNGVLSSIDENTKRYEVDISRRVKEGNNYVQVTPRSRLNIVELAVEYR